MLKNEFEKRIKNQAAWIHYATSNNKNGSTFVICHRENYTIKTEIPRPTKEIYTEKNLNALNSFLKREKNLFREWKSVHLKNEKERKKTPEYKKAMSLKKIRDIAISAGLVHDEHGGYGRGDHHSLKVIDAVTKKRELKKFFASGEFLAIVADGRTRIYSNAYMCNHGPSCREDLYLVGKNENGVPFVHGVSKNCFTVKKAVDWIWNNTKITNRQGDIALCPCNLKKEGKFVEDTLILDNHHFSGEIVKNRSTYIRNGTLLHTKKQHPSIEVGSDWKRVVFAKRALIGGSHD